MRPGEDSHHDLTTYVTLIRWSYLFAGCDLFHDWEFCWLVSVPGKVGLYDSVKGAICELRIVDG
jgi:hypothetical protein